MSTSNRRFFKPRSRRFSRILLLLIGGVAAFLLWPSPIDPVPLKVQRSPGFTGAYDANTRLQQACSIALSEDLLEKGYHGPEDVALTPDGFLYAGLENGALVRMRPDGSSQAVIPVSGGRPLGLAIDAQGDLLIADGIRGLLRLGAGEETITQEAINAETVMLGIADDLDIADDGIVYYSDAAMNFPLEKLHLTFLSAQQTGRLIAYDPETKTSRTLMKNLIFANGVAVSLDAGFVLVVDTALFRVYRYWLKGPRAGEYEIFIDNLPGFPDGISRAPDGSFWIALYGPRSDMLDDLQDKVWIKKQLGKLPGSLFQPTHAYGAILHVDSDGQVIETLQDPSGEVIASVTSVEQVGDRLWLGSLKGKALHYLELGEQAGQCS